MRAAPHLTCASSPPDPPCPAPLHRRFQAFVPCAPSPPAPALMLLSPGDRCYLLLSPPAGRPPPPVRRALFPDPVSGTPLSCQTFLVAPVPVLNMKGGS